MVDALPPTRRARKLKPARARSNHRTRGRGKDVHSHGAHRRKVPGAGKEEETGLCVLAVAEQLGNAGRAGTAASSTQFRLEHTLIRAYCREVQRGMYHRRE